MHVFKLLFRSFNGKDIGFRLDSLNTILQQEVLLQEDVELIELLDPSILSAGQSQQQENGYLPTLGSLATPNIWYCPKNIYPLLTCSLSRGNPIIVLSTVKAL